MRKKFISICVILSMLLFTIIGVILYQSNAPDTNSVQINLIFNSFTSVTMSKEDGKNLIDSLENASAHNVDFDMYSTPPIATFQFVKKHCYTNGLYFKDLFSYENKFYDVPKEFYDMICNYLNGENLLKNAISNVKTVKIKNEDINGRYMTLSNDHVNDIKNILSSSQASDTNSSDSPYDEKNSKYIIKLYGESSDSLDLYVVNDHTVYVKDALSGNRVTLNSDDLLKLVNSLFKN